MRPRSTGFFFLLALSLFFVARPAAAELITFEELTPGGGPAPVLDFYANRGVIFGASALDFTNGPLVIPNFAHSGTNAVETCFAIEFCKAPIEVTFTVAQAHVSVFAGFDGALGEAVTVVMRGFAADGSQVAQASVTLGPSTTPTPIQTPLGITTPTATIVRVTVGVESGGAPSFSNGLAIDDVEFDTAGPPPPCTAPQPPTVVLSQPASGTILQFNQFLLAFVVTSGDPFATATVTNSGPGGTKTATFPGFNGAFGPTIVGGLLVPGPSTLTVAVTDCRGTAQTAANITFTPIAPDEQFHVLGLEATQVLQNIPSSVPLVADKPTFVRVYLRVSGGTQKITGVRGTLVAYRPANSSGDIGQLISGSVRSSNAIAVDQSTDLKARRLELTESLNFQLPADWITRGKAHFEVTLDVEGSPSSPVSIPCNGCHNIIGTGFANFQTFHTMPRLRMRVVGLDYNGGTGTSPHTTRAADFALFQSWVQRAFPAANFTFTNSSVTSTNTFPFTCDQANAELASIRATELAAGTDRHTKYMALVINTGGFMRGCSSGVPDSPDTSVVASSPTGDTANLPGSDPKPRNVIGDTDLSWGDWYAGHELSHTFGRKHPGFCNSNSDDDDDFTNPNGQISDNLQTYVGLDRGDAANGIPMTVISPFAFDIMTYCNQPQWFSAHNYEGVFDRFRAENGVPANDFAPTAGARESTGAQAGPDGPSGDFVSIVATVNLTTHTGTIKFIDHVGRAADQGPLQNQLAAVRFVDAAGRVLGTFTTWVRENSDLDQTPGADRTGLVQIVVPVERAAASLELMLEGKVVSRRAISKHAPVVKALKISELATLLGKRGRTLTWLGVDLDVNPLTYLVQLSGEGDTWETVATGLTVSKVTLTDEQIGPRPRRVRVIANDGFNVSEPATIEIAPAK
ncbi:MAG: hypothetical protein ABIT71_05395 [Vicinamibacteraceae bacterium]